MGEGREAANRVGVGGGVSPASTRATDSVVVLPRAPGRVRPVPKALHPDDDLDAAVDEVFGDGSTDRAGRTDVLLVVIGGTALGGGLILANGLFTTVGIIAIVLGVALPLEAAFRGVERRRLAIRQGRVLRGGYAIDTSSPETAALIRAYESLIGLTDDRTAQPDLRRQYDDARSAAHAAVVEVATLIDGGSPDGESQRDYVRKRTDAIDRVTRGLQWLEVRRSARRPAGADAPRAGSRARAMTLAREQLEAEAGVSGLSQLESLGQDLGEGPHG